MTYAAVLLLPSFASVKDESSLHDSRFKSIVQSATSQIEYATRSGKEAATMAAGRRAGYEDYAHHGAVQ